MINQSFISKSHSSVIPNCEISKGHHSDLKMKEEDLKEILQYFEKQSSVAQTTSMSVKEFNPLANPTHKTVSPQVEFSYSYWLKKMNVENHIQDNLIQQIRQGGGTAVPSAIVSTPTNGEIEKEEMVHDRTLYQTTCTPNAHGVYGFRRLQLHQESGLPARHYKPILKHGVMGWGENFNLKLQSPILSSDSQITPVSSSPQPRPQPQQQQPQQSFLEPLRSVPSPLRALFYERAHLLNLSQGLYDLESGKPLYPEELSDGEHVLRLASSHYFVQDLSPESLFSFKRKRNHVVQLPFENHSTQPEEELYQLSSLDQAPELEPESESQQQNVELTESTELLMEADTKRRRVTQEEIEVEEILQRSLQEFHASSIPPEMERNAKVPEDDHHIPTENEFQDLLGCAQVK